MGKLLAFGLVMLAAQLTLAAPATPPVSLQVYNLTSFSTREIQATVRASSYKATIAGPAQVTCYSDKHESYLSNDGTFSAPSLRLRSCGLWTQGYDYEIIFFMPKKIGRSSHRYSIGAYKTENFDAPYPQTFTIFEVPESKFQIAVKGGGTIDDWERVQKSHGYPVILKSVQVKSAYQTIQIDGFSSFSPYSIRNDDFYALWGVPSQLTQVAVIVKIMGAQGYQDDNYKVYAQLEKKMSIQDVEKFLTNLKLEIDPSK